MDARCPVCGETIEVADTATGRIGHCAACKSLYEVASAGRLRAVGVQDDDGDSGKGSGSGPDVRYKCAKCKSVLKSPSALAGQSDQCPICGHSNVVPRRRKRKKAKHQEELVPLEADAQGDGNVFASEEAFDLEAGSGDGEAGRTSAAIDVHAEDPSEIPIAADEVSGQQSD